MSRRRRRKFFLLHPGAWRSSSETCSSSSCCCCCSRGGRSSAAAAAAYSSSDIVLILSAVTLGFFSTECASCSAAEQANWGPSAQILQHSKPTGANCSARKKVRKPERKYARGCGLRTHPRFYAALQHSNFTGGSAPSMPAACSTASRAIAGSPNGACQFQTNPRRPTPAHLHGPSPYRAWRGCR